MDEQQPLLDISALRKIDAKPGDVFVLELPEDSPEMHRIQHQIRMVLGEGVKVLMLPPGAKLTKQPALKAASIGFAPVMPDEDWVELKYVVGLRLVDHQGAITHDRLATELKIPREMLRYASPVVHSVCLRDLRSSIRCAVAARFGKDITWTATFIRQVSLEGPAFALEEVRKEFGEQVAWEPKAVTSDEPAVVERKIAFREFF